MFDDDVQKTKSQPKDRLAFCYKLFEKTAPQIRLLLFPCIRSLLKLRCVLQTDGLKNVAEQVRATRWGFEEPE